MTRAPSTSWPILWKELHQNAQACLNKERAGHTLQASALVNEAFIRLVDVKGLSGATGRDRPKGCESLALKNVETVLIRR